MQRHAGAHKHATLTSGTTWGPKKTDTRRRWAVRAAGFPAGRQAQEGRRGGHVPRVVSSRLGRKAGGATKAQLPRQGDAQGSSEPSGPWSWLQCGSPTLRHSRGHGGWRDWSSGGLGVQRRFEFDEVESVRYPALQQCPNLCAPASPASPIYRAAMVLHPRPPQAAVVAGVAGRRMSSFADECLESSKS